MDRNELATKLLAAIKEGLEWLGIPRGALDRADEIIFMVFIVIIGLSLIGEGLFRVIFQGMPLL